MATARSIRSAVDPIVVLRSVNGDGETYALEPRSLDRLREKFGDAVHARARLFLTHESRADYEHVHGLVAPHVVLLLTGISEEKLAGLGGVIFRDAVTDRELSRT